MKKIVVLTATRAEYGLLAPIIKKMISGNKLDVRVVATGAHLSPEFGMTVNQIEADGIRVDRKIEILLSSDTGVSVSKSMGLAMISFSEYFDELKPDALMVLGDRYETLAVCSVALNLHIPIIHLHGGEATEGAIDEAVRNAITKLSYLHFTSTEEYRRRVIQMGENPDRVFNVGAVGVENALNSVFYDKKQLEQELGCNLQRYAVLTFHPVTLEIDMALTEAEELMKAITDFPDIIFICTKANADAEGRIINNCIHKYSEKYSNIKLYDSLGVKKYLSALKYAEFVIGNSSSGIIEAPSFKIPTINIGDRQKGRIQAESVINCNSEKEEIKSAINKALNCEYRNRILDVKNPYGDGNTSKKIVDITTDYLINNKLKLQKKFYDII